MFSESFVAWDRRGNLKIEPGTDSPEKKSGRFRCFKISCYWKWLVSTFNDKNITFQGLLWSPLVAQKSVFLGSSMFHFLTSLMLNMCWGSIMLRVPPDKIQGQSRRINHNKLARVMIYLWCGKQSWIRCQIFQPSRDFLFWGFQPWGWWCLSSHPL